MSAVKITFLGAARQVTGSCYYLEAGGLKLLVDCGLYQERPFLERNWNPFPIPPDDIDFLLLTHAHLDHSGLIPKIVREGFSGEILATAPTADILSIALMDSARIQEEDAAFKKKRHAREGRNGPHPEVPLYTVEDVQGTMPLVEDVPYDEPVALNRRVSARFRDAGHILGSAMIELMVRENGTERRIVFSGDIGQWDKPFVRDPSVFTRADYVVMESTYADRLHEDPAAIDVLLADAVNSTLRAGGNLVVPTFAIERAQELMYFFGRLVETGKIPRLRFFLDSPMARQVTEAFRRHPEVFDEDARKLFASGKSPFEFPGLSIVRTIEESKAINDLPGTSVIMAGSGMCTGGRIKHHLIHNIARPESTVLFVGYQARETLGRQILEKRSPVRIHGQTLEVKAQIKKINGFSAHADRNALERWLGAFQSAPRCLFVTHGDADAALGFAERIRSERGWNVDVPDYLDTQGLD